MQKYITRCTWCFCHFWSTCIILNTDFESKWQNFYFNPLSLASLILILQKEVGIKVTFQYGTTVTFWQFWINNHNSDFFSWKGTCKYFFTPSTDWETSPAASHFVRKTAWDATPGISLLSVLWPHPMTVCIQRNGQIHLFVRESRGVWERGTDLTLALAAVWVDKV